jgi:hypothetical protein
LTSARVRLRSQIARPVPRRALAAAFSHGSSAQAPIQAQAGPGSLSRIRSVNGRSRMISGVSPATGNQNAAYDDPEAVSLSR